MRRDRAFAALVGTQRNHLLAVGRKRPGQTSATRRGTQTHQVLAVGLIRRDRPRRKPALFSCAPVVSTDHAVPCLSVLPS